MKKELAKYLPFYIGAILISTLEPVESVKQSLADYEAITITAFFASLVFAFAEFAKSERWCRFIVKYIPVCIFGVYTRACWDKPVGMFILACGMSIHGAVWLASCHSRGYRLRQFLSGFAAQMPATAQRVTMYNVQGISDEADEVVRKIMDPKEGHQSLLSRSEEEIKQHLKSLE